MFQILHYASRKCGIMIKLVPIVTAFNNKHMCFQVELIEGNRCVGKAAIILEKGTFISPTKSVYFNMYCENECNCKRIAEDVEKECINMAHLIWG